MAIPAMAERGRRSAIAKCMHGSLLTAYTHNPRDSALLDVVREKQNRARVLDPSKVKTAISTIDKTFRGFDQQVEKRVASSLCWSASPHHRHCVSL